MTLQEQLLELFMLDKQVRGMRGRLDTAAARAKAKQSRLDQLNQQQQELHSQHLHAQAKAKALENQSNEVEQRIVHLRDQMQNVKSNKEYSAVLLEVNTLKLEKSKVEDEAIGQLGNVEQLAEELETIRGQVADQEKLLAAAQDEVTQCRDEVGQELDDLQAKRDEAEKVIPSDVSTLFNRMAEMHEGESMASVSEVSRRHREYTCNGCYLNVPVEHVNSLMTLPNQATCCPSCSRILYIDHELKTSIGAK